METVLRLSYWLDTSVTQQPAGPAMWLVAAFGVLVIAGGAAAARRAGRPAGLAWMAAGALIALVALGRLFAVPGLGWRIGWLIAAGVAALPPAVRGARDAVRTGFAADAVRALSFISPEPAQRASWLALGLWLGLHVVALAAVFSVIRVPGWLALAAIALLVAAPLVARRPVRSAALALAPLLVPYAVLAARVAAGLLTRAATGEYRVLEPWASLLNLPLAALVACGYAAALSAFLAAPGRRFAAVASAALIAGTAAWSAWTAAELRTHGVSGSDPYAYAQMGVDLATRGTVFHPFPLVRVTYDLHIPSEPIIHVGYKIPQDIGRTATTVWPPGYAVFTALGYLIAGEAGLYWITPVLGLLSLAAVAAFAARAAPFTPGAGLWAAVAVTVCLTATSYQQVEWQLIPMADIASQLFSILALTLALRARGRGAYARAALSGLCIGIAFSVRYTQVLIAPGVALALLEGARGDRANGPSALLRQPPVLRVAACAACAAVAAVPVLAYHTYAFGGPFHVGSEEGANFSLARAPETFMRTVHELMWYREFGLLAPLLAVGAGALWRRSRFVALVLVAYTAPVFLLHIAYWPLRLRDILSLFPVFGLLAATGAVELVAWARARLAEAPGRAMAAPALAAAALMVLAFSLTLRTLQTAQLPLTRGFGAFGYLVREQRASFERLRQLTPQGAVVGSTLNSGAIDLHAGRLSFRPAAWSADQVQAFVQQLQREGAPVYVLVDGDEVLPAVLTLRERFGLDEVARLDVPYYFPGSGSENRAVPLYRVIER